MSGKVVFITGGSRGLGGATARALAARGDQVIITDILDEAGQDLATEIGATYLHQDVGCEKAWNSIARDVIDRYGRVDVLMNNAGVLHQEPLLGHSTEDWNRLILVNQTSVFFGMRSFGAYMIKQKTGSIINVASVAAKQCVAGTMAYTASKSAMIGMTKVAAREFGPLGVRVNVLLPGMMDTQMVDDIDPDRKGRERLLKSVPLRRTAGPDEIAKMAVFLASDDSSYCCGETFQVDGGSAC